MIIYDNIYIVLVTNIIKSRIAVAPIGTFNSSKVKKEVPKSMSSTLTKQH